eukprot:m.3344 g.3344  ORF g.3344 m.3344 type:complete len:99 (+) comp9280_c0_seq1:22-318(+)
MEAGSVPKFSRHHPMIPRRYVPGWQLDMKNRKATIENCTMAGVDNWKGHVSMFLTRRERLGEKILYREKAIPRCLWHNRSSSLSKYNSSLLACRSHVN